MSAPAYPNTCPVCHEPAGKPCRSRTKGKVTDTHAARIEAAYRGPSINGISRGAEEDPWREG